MSRDLGDFQTPLDLCRSIVRQLDASQYARVLEPTCGCGSFLRAVKEVHPGLDAIGIELQDRYLPSASQSGARIVHADLFRTDLRRDIDWQTDGPLLVLGNPPWVTSSELGSLGSINIPKKSNLKGLAGFDALTGASNFDIAEYIILKLIAELHRERPVIAMLCKTQVARNVFEYCQSSPVKIGDFSVRRIEAKKWFNAAVDACLFIFRVDGERGTECDMYADLHADEPTETLGYIDGRLVSDVRSYTATRDLDGVSPVVWRQGVKHDAAKVMELAVESDGRLKNKLGDEVDVEQEYVYPLLKSTDIHRARLKPRRALIVPQINLADSARDLATRAPRLWRYLTSHGDAFDKRKSSIYTNKHRFAIFGIGDYSFTPWKIAVSGLHKSAGFQLIGPNDDRPVMVDDTSYILPFDDEAHAALVITLLRHDLAQAFIRAVTYSGAKRPITKRLLQRIDLAALVDAVGGERVVEMTKSAFPSVANVSDDSMRGLRRSWESPSLLAMDAEAPAASLLSR